MQVSVELVHRGDMRCETKLAEGGRVMRVDSLKHRGREGYGQSPLDLLALAHGGCTAMLAAMKGAAEGVEVRDMDVEVAHEYEDGPPMKLKSARIRFLVPGGVSAEQAAKMKAAAAMCPVHTALRADIPVTMEFATRPR